MQFASNGLSTEKPISTVADPDRELRFFVTCPASFSSFCDSFFFTQNKGGGGWAPQAPRSATAQSGSQKASPMNFKNEKGKKKKKRKEKKNKLVMTWILKNLLGNFTHLESAPYC